MATTADFKNGLCMEINGELFTIVQFQHVKPGKGPAFVRTKIRNLKTAKVIDKTFTAGVKIDLARIERRPHQFLYKEEAGYVFMHNETYEQMTINEEIIESADLLKEGQNVEIVVHADTETPLTCELPPFIEMEVTYTEPGLRGDTSSSSSLKQATVETGATINVPLFINTGDLIRIDTRDRSYSERVKG
jgi:elongation factor P